MQDELTLKELVIAIQDYFRYFLGKWYWMVLGGLLFGGLFFYNAWTTPVTYSAPLTFMLNEKQDVSFGAGALLGSLGLGSGGGSSSNAYRLQELGRSRQVITQVLFDSITVNGTEQMLADHLIDVYYAEMKWEKNDSLRDFRFRGRLPQPGDIAANKALKALHRWVILSPEHSLLTITVDEDSGLFTINASTTVEELSFALSNGLYNYLSAYFISTAVAGKKASLERLNIQADSVAKALQQAEVRLAQFRDRSAFVPLQQSSIRGQALNREVLILSTLYGEIVKNRETASFLLANEKPAFNLVDLPLIPLEAERVSLIKPLVIGGVLGGGLVLLILFGNKFIRDALSPAEEG